jgi:HSP20 family molecular chaperone IbpA
MTDEKKDEEKRLTPKDYWMSDSFGEMRRLLDSFRANMEETLERVFPSQASLPALKQPRVDILDLGNALQVVADMPGVRKEDIELNLKPERVEISAESSTETERKEEDYTYRERGYASYRRVIDLPADVLPDKAEASFKNGVLEVNLPKKEPTELEKTTKVQIKSDTLDRGHHWLTVQLRNRSTEPLTDVSATLFTYNSHDIDVLPSGSFHFLKELHPKDTAALNFHVFANHSGRLYLHVTAYRNGTLVSWYSPDQDLRLMEDPAEIVYASQDVQNLTLEIAARPPSKAHTLMDVFDIDFIAQGETKKYVSQLYASEEGTYLLTARLFHDKKLISSKHASCYVAPFEE